VRRLLREAALQYRVNTEPVAIKLREAGWISERTLESFRRIRPVVIPRREKVDPELPDGLTETQAERRSLAAETGFTTYYLELLRRGLTRDEITFGRFAEMLDMDTDRARVFALETGLAL
jgi:hypothetical protein